MDGVNGRTDENRSGMEPSLILPLGLSKSKFSVANWHKVCLTSLGDAENEFDSLQTRRQPGIGRFAGDSAVGFIDPFRLPFAA